MKRDIRKDILELIIMYMYVTSVIFGLAYLLNGKIISTMASILITTGSYFVLKKINRDI